MKRKLVQQGNSTLMISLPSKWLKENNLGKGDEVNLEEDRDRMILSIEEINSKKEANIEINDLTESLIRTLITNTYRRGYDLIHVSFKNKEQFKILSEVIKTRLIGFEIIKGGNNKCSVENVTEPSLDQFDNILKKMFLSIEELFEITEKRFGGDKVDCTEVEERIQKYDNFCRRVMSKRKLTTDHSEMLWTFLTLIVHGQREIFHLNKILDKGIKLSPKTKILLKNTEEIFQLIKKAYSEKKVEVLEEIHKKEKELIYKKGYALIEESRGKERIVVYHLLASIRQFYQANSPLIGLIL